MYCADIFYHFLGPPGPPSSLRVLRPVNQDAILLGWSLPDMDEFGRSNGVVVKGYKVKHVKKVSMRRVGRRIGGVVCYYQYHASKTILSFFL